MIGTLETGNFGTIIAGHVGSNQKTYVILFFVQLYSMLCKNPFLIIFKLAENEHSNFLGFFK